MASVSAHVDRGRLAAFMNKPGGPVDRAVRQPLEATAALGTATAPVDTGFLRNNYSIDVDGGPGAAHGVLTYHAPYTQFVIKGTGIYGPRAAPITPKNGKYMVFRGRDGGLVYATETKGQRAQPFIQNAFRTACPWPVTIHL